MSVKGLSVLFVPHVAGAVAKKEQCRVCGTEMGMTVENCAGSWVEAMARSQSLHKVYRCPMVWLEWHEQAEKIRLEAEATRSPSLKKLLDGDVMHICRDALSKTTTGKPRRKGHVRSQD